MCHGGDFSDYHGTGGVQLQEKYDENFTLKHGWHLVWGEYSVRWRAVSSDGHPITGSYEFLVGADAVAGSAVTAVPAESGTAADGEDTESANASDDGGLPAWLVPGIVGGLVGLLLYAGYSVLSRRKRARTESSDR